MVSMWVTFTSFLQIYLFIGRQNTPDLGSRDANLKTFGVATAAGFATEIFPTEFRQLSCDAQLPLLRHRATDLHVYGS